MTNSFICVPMYPLAPHHNYTHVFPALEKFYADLCTKNRSNLPVNIIGDSSGGGIALSFAQMIRNNHMPVAEKVILLSPSVDMTPLNKEEESKALILDKLDCMLSLNSMDTIRS